MSCLSRLLLLASLLLSQPTLAAELFGRVVGIADGDTLTLLTPERQQVKVRLYGIDAPESRQPYGTRAQQELSALAFRKEVRVVVEDTDRYGRKVGRVWAGPVDVNAELVRRGAAWVYRQYNRDPALPRLEAEARQAKRGLWSLPPQEQVPPWDWRRQGSPRTAAPTNNRGGSAAPAQSSAGLSCGAKRYCGEMRDCAEARFYLQQCGLRRLDGDGDGVPCERLCR
ncbi:thermonuclease family protein [Roseomonas marmotae]|uniref:Thermonuclease family protein n=1 Tax=Roseomonas marmotae TaxID=2768161 RepID=A0ABS3KKY6_9PROT|nr:thermonuclease family protein [Roseomonas marmotae]MBO1077253.1 thermonuclease family protein [Roseomonas marmotae]QTI82094.1 thermonuclease family protein [Roseomonas marmotae]